MVMLKNLKKTNLLPIFDPKRVSGTSKPKKEDVYFLLLNASHLQKHMNFQTTSSFLFSIPCSNEEMSFCRFPQQEKVEIRKLKKWQINKNTLGAAVGSFKPKGDDFVSPELSQDNSPIHVNDSHANQSQVLNDSAEDDFS